MNAAVRSGPAPARGFPPLTLEISVQFFAAPVDLGGERVADPEYEQQPPDGSACPLTREGRGGCPLAASVTHPERRGQPTGRAPGGGRHEAMAVPPLLLLLLPLLLLPLWHSAQFASHREGESRVNRE